MKKIIALMLVLLLMLTMFVACKKDEVQTDDPDTPGTSDPTDDPSDPSDDPADEELTWDDVEGVEDTKQHDGDGIELPIVPIQ